MCVNLPLVYLMPTPLPIVILTEVSSTLLYFSIFATTNTQSAAPPHSSSHTSPSLPKLVFTYRYAAEQHLAAN